MAATTLARDVTATLDDYRWLTGSSAQPWLARAADELAAGVPLVQLTSRLRRELPAERTHLVLEQVELRQRATEKFSRAQEMFFTPLGLAQTTDEPLGRYKARRFPREAPLTDLCCGIGGDLVSLGAGRTCVGIDRDPVAAHLAEVNAAVCGIKSAAVRCDMVSAAALDGAACWHIDPDRRPAGQRTVQAERFDPPWEVIETLLGRCGNGAVKLAPATRLMVGAADRCQREWIESRGECRQQVAWFGKMARLPGSCAATAIDADGGAATIVGAPDEPADATETVGRYVYEPCAAVRAAHLAGAVCREMGAALLSGGSSYLTSERRASHPLAATFEVLSSLAFDMRRLKEVVRQLGIGAVEVKKRGVDVDPEDVRRRLMRAAGKPGVVLIAKIGLKTTAIVARRLPLA